jgi:hypothetical protein
MSDTLRTTTWSVVVSRYEHQPAEIQDEAERTDRSVDDVVLDRIEEVMHAAGQAYIDAHPEQFRRGTGLV